jgi:hypothetical protein
MLQDLFPVTGQGRGSRGAREASSAKVLQDRELGAEEQRSGDHRFATIASRMTRAITDS